MIDANINAYVRYPGSSEEGAPSSFLKAENQRELPRSVSWRVSEINKINKHRTDTERERNNYQQINNLFDIYNV